MQEDSHTEFKSSFSDSVIESLVAFTNAGGGRVIIGVDDKGIPVKGFTIGTESIQKWINEVKNKTKPSIIPDAEIIQVDTTDVLELSVKEFPIKPVSFKGRYYKRVKNSNHQLSLAEISDLHLKTFNSSWDSYVNPEYSLESLSMDKVRRFIAKCNDDRDISIQDDPLTVLNKFELIKSSDVTNACFLLFSNSEIFSSTIELGRFDTATSIKDSLSIRSDLFTEVDEVIDFVRKHINKSYIISGDPQREERWQYPIQTIREIVINMIVHRDYTHYGDSSIKIYNDRIEFFNPGRLPDDISIVNLLSGQYVSQARNKKIAAIFKEGQLIEKYGSGIKRIQESFINHGLTPPLFENLQHGFHVTVYSRMVSEKMLGEASAIMGKVSEKTSEKILSLIKEDASITIAALTANLAISNRSIERSLIKLQKEKRLKRVGSDKGGHWEIVQIIVPEKTSEKIEKVSEKTSEKILSLIKEDASITIATLTANLAISSRSIERNLIKLQREKQLKRVGSDKGGHWEIVQKIVSEKTSEKMEEVSEKTSEKIEEVSEKTSEKILSLIKENTSITIASLVANLSISNQLIQTHLNKLQKERKLERIGSDTKGYWQIL